MRTIRLIVLVPLVSLVFAAPAGANHDADVGNRTRHVQAHPCWSDMKILESPGEQTLTGPGGPNLRNITKITGSTDGGCRIPSPGLGADFVNWSASFSGPSGSCADADVEWDYPVTDWGNLNCPINNPATGTYTLNLHVVIHPYLDPAEDGCVKQFAYDGVYKVCDWALRTLVVDLPA
ncbi:MAG: hypothetical protein HYU28_07880 [Actinobacteria bacterium]|nr:hypothetical protein [Actinomycetota bacterium]